MVEAILIGVIIISIFGIWQELKNPEGGAIMRLIGRSPSAG